MDNIYDMIWYDIISSFFPQTMAKFFLPPNPSALHFQPFLWKPPQIAIWELSVYVLRIFRHQKIGNSM